MSAKHQKENEPRPAEGHPYNLRAALVRFERGYLSNILELTRWNRTKAARMLGIGLDLLASKIRDHKLSPGDKPSPETEDQTR